MKIIIVTGTAALLLLAGTIVPTYAQKNERGDKQTDKRTDKRTDKQKEKQRKRGSSRGDQDRGAQPSQRGPQLERQQQERPQQARHRPEPQRTREQARSWQQQRGWVQGGGWQGRGTWQESRARRWSFDHRSWVQRGGYGGYYIPENRFSLYFGSQHFFRLRTRPAMYLGYPRFEYGGFSFLLVDPWPEYWPDQWYDSDDVYIDYDDGYYLHNRRYSQVRLAITIVL